MITIRPQQVKDAQRFFTILTNPHFIYWSSIPKSLAEEIAYLKKTKEKSDNNIEHNFTILYNKKIAGAVGMKINQHRPHIGEVGYFVDAEYWGKGIASQAVQLIEKHFQGKLKRIELVTLLANTASSRVAEKCGYTKEGIARSLDEFKGKYADYYMYAKVLDETS